MSPWEAGHRNPRRGKPQVCYCPWLSPSLGAVKWSTKELAPEVPGNGLSGDFSSVMESSGGGYRWGNRG